jgi:putative FmdB family regulatory protein
VPIYEFYCVRCNKLMNFFSRRVNVEAQPDCPHCGERLSRQVSHFSAVSGNDFSDDLGDAPIDDARVMDAVERLGGKLDAVPDDDPRQAAALMREFTEASGLQFNRDIRDAMRRIESGEDPDVVSAEMEEIIGTGDGTFEPSDRARSSGKTPPPTRDETLYDL